MSHYIVSNLCAHRTIDLHENVFNSLSSALDKVVQAQKIISGADFDESSILSTRHATHRPSKSSKLIFFTHSGLPVSSPQSESLPDIGVIEKASATTEISEATDI